MGWSRGTFNSVVREDFSEEVAPNLIRRSLPGGRNSMCKGSSATACQAYEGTLRTNQAKELFCAHSAVSATCNS